MVFVVFKVSQEVSVYGSRDHCKKPSPFTAMERYHYEQRSSGLSVRSYCRQHQLKEATYYRYLKLLHEELINVEVVPKVMEPPSSFSKTGSPSTFA